MPNISVSRSNDNTTEFEYIRMHKFITITCYSNVLCQHSSSHFPPSNCVVPSRNSFGTPSLSLSFSKRQLLLKSFPRGHRRHTSFGHNFSVRSITKLPSGVHITLVLLLLGGTKLWGVHHFVRCTSPQSAMQAESGMAVIVHNRRKFCQNDSARNYSRRTQMCVCVRSVRRIQPIPFTRHFARRTSGRLITLPERCGHCVFLVFAGQTVDPMPPDTATQKQNKTRRTEVCRRVVNKPAPTNERSGYSV